MRDLRDELDQQRSMAKVASCKALLRVEFWERVDRIKKESRLVSSDPGKRRSTVRLRGNKREKPSRFARTGNRRVASSLSPRRRLAPSAHADGSAPWGSQGWGLARVGSREVGAREPHRSLPPSGTSGGFLDPMGASDFDPAAVRAQARFPRPALVRRFPALCFSRVTSVPRIPANGMNPRYDSCRMPALTLET